MSSPAVAALPALYDVLASVGAAPIAIDERSRALDRFFSTPSGREKPGRFWKVDFETLEPDASAIDTGSANMRVEHRDPRVLVCDLATASREHPDLFARAFGATSIQTTKFGALATAFSRLGLFVWVPADHACGEPIFIEYNAPGDAAIFPYTVVLAERGSSITIVERLAGDPGSFICNVAEVVTEELADVSYASLQRTAGTHAISNRAVRPGRDARVAWACAELGGDVAAGDIRVAIESPGSQAGVTTLFFPRASQHVDVVSTISHQAGEATSETLVKTAALENGQARFLGNIVIAPHAQGSDARLRDDALLLSPQAHVDSVPALEIGANDVKAYHGATVGALDEDEIFYMQSRGIERSAAERMIALGFFEPAIERFPTNGLRDEIRTLLAAKLT